MTIIIKNLAITGYRSFGSVTQYFDEFSKINLIIGRNNAGKSNLIRFLSEVYPTIGGFHIPRPPADQLFSKHLSSQSSILMGVGERVDIIDGKPHLRVDHPLLQKVQDQNIKTLINEVVGVMYKSIKDIEGTNLCWANFDLQQKRFHNNNAWSEAAYKIDRHNMQKLWNQLTNMEGGEQSVWVDQIIQRAQPELTGAKVMVIPAKRRIERDESNREASDPFEFNGVGMIDRLARLESPPAQDRESKKRFEQVRDFLRVVTDNSEADITVPYDRDTINVYMDGRWLPLESLGTGVHEVVILAVAATVFENHVVCIEEPELHLNPILQKKLMRYLANHTSNQYFITTHSAALMDTPDSEIYHVKLENGASIVERATTDRQKSDICEELGYHPSDLLQANCILWVEGPSDRTYLNFWIHSINSDLIEGIHYSIMFYGGRLISHLSNEDMSKSTEDFILLRRLNRRGMIVIDSDRSTKSAKINNSKKRLQKEFNTGPGHAWITAGREIENYIPESQILGAIESTAPNAQIQTRMEKYEKCLSIKSVKGREHQASKVEVAKYISENYSADLSKFDLEKQILKVIMFIKDSNPR